MIVFYTKTTAHLASLIHLPKGQYLAGQFSDGEWYLTLESDVANQDVWVITATNSPADNLLELFLLLNVLQKNSARIHLLFTYFGYARQDNPLPSQGSGAQMVSTLLNTFKLKKIIIVHAHSVRLHTYLNFENIIPTDLICEHTPSYDAIAAPDQGAYELIDALSKKCKIEPIFLKKIRPAQEEVKILEYNGMVKAKKVLIIDDIIATGNTIIEVAKVLETLGATHVSVWATHGIFSNHAIRNIENSSIKKVYVTNTLPQKHTSSKIEIVSIAPLLEKIIGS